MTHIHVIENKISDVRNYLDILESFKKYSLEIIVNDLMIRGALERYLYLVAQATIDLAEAVISYKHFRKPSTLSESFSILNEENILSVELTEKLIRMSGFRNLIAHDYAKINYEKVYGTLQHRLPDIQDFIKIVENIR